MSMSESLPLPPSLDPRETGQAAPPGPAPAGRAWYVVYSKPHKEGTALFHLERRSIEVYYPKLVLPAYVAGPRRVVPLFPSYLFVRINLVEQFYDVIWSPGVKRFVGPHGVPTALDDDVVAFLQEHAAPDGTLQARSTLRVGQEVEITGGPFAGIVGIIQQPPDARGRIKVLMQLLNRRAVRVDVPVRFVKSGWTVAGTGPAVHRVR